MSTSVLVTSLNQLRYRPWTSAHHLGELGRRICATRQGSRGSASYTKGLGFWCSTSRQFAGHRLHRLTIVPNFIFFSPFFNSLGIIYVLRVKQNNNSYNTLTTERHVTSRSVLSSLSTSNVGNMSAAVTNSSAIHDIVSTDTGR